MSELVARSIKQAELDEKLRLWVKENLKVEGQAAYVLSPPDSVGRAANYARIYGGVRVGVAIEERRELYIMSLKSVDFDLNKALRRISKKKTRHTWWRTPTNSGCTSTKTTLRNLHRRAKQEDR